MTGESVTIGVRRRRTVGPLGPPVFDLLRELVVRDVRLRYRRSMLGIAWSQLVPLSMIAMFSFVFNGVVPLHIKNYPSFVFTGLLAWIWFQSGLTAATSSVVDNRDLVRQPAFPLDVLPPVAIAGQLVNYLLALPVLFVFVAVTTGRIPITAIALPAILAIQFIIMLGPSYLLSALNVRFRDVGHLVGIITLLMFYATPVFYDASNAPSRFHLVFQLNPMSHLVESYRDSLLYGRWPRVGPLLAIGLAGAAFVVIFRRVFLSQSRVFVQEL